MIILASASPRRRQLLENLGLSFTVCPTDCDESCDISDPGEYVCTIACRKAVAAQKNARPEDIVIAADTAVFAGGKILNKPCDATHAAEMLRLLSGNTHRVYTGLALSHKGQLFKHIESTQVTFRPLSNKHIEDYIASGEPFDKAGGYGIQGLGSLFVSSIEGDFFNVMGLPLCSLGKMLEALER